MAGNRVEWNEAELSHILYDPDGACGQAIGRLGEIALASARRRALRRTGRMADEMFSRVTRGVHGPAAEIHSPARSVSQRYPEGFPYPLVFERRGKTRNRPPHRSLIPALNDVKRWLAKRQ